MWKMTKFVAFIAKLNSGKAVIGIYIVAKDIQPLYITNKTKRFSFKIRCFVRVENDEIRRLYSQINFFLY